MFKYLRIAVTALSLTACVLLIALWVRSHDWVYLVAGGVGHNFYLQSLGGQIGLYAFTHVSPSWQFVSYELTPDLQQFQTQTAWKFEAQSNGDWFVVIPYWAPILMTLAVATLPWIQWPKRFSLRTLLIAT